MLLREAKIFSEYLIKEKVSEELLNRYECANQKLNYNGTKRDKKIIAIILRFPYLLPFIDSALAFSNSKSLLRKKIWVMLAILETTPEYYEHYTTKNYNKTKWLSIIFIGCWAILKMMIGKFILIFI